MQRNSLTAVLLMLIAVPVTVSAQSVGSSTGSAIGGASSLGSSTTGSSSQLGGSTTSGSQTGSTTGASRDPQDDISDIAPPFSVDDVIRMHRVGLQDEVIINALRARYHPFKLTASERTELEQHSVSAAVIAAIEDPLGEAAAAKATPPFVPPTSHSKVDSKAKAVAAPLPPVKPVTAAVPDGTQKPVMAAATTAPALPAPKPPPPAYISPADMPDYTRTIDKLKLPSAPGVYRRINGGDWIPVASENILWQHSSWTLRGLLAGKVCGTTTTTGGADFLVVTEPGSSIVQVQLLRVSADHEGRAFTPTSDGDAFGGADNSKAVPYSPQKLNDKVWLVSLHDLPPGDYGFLPPNQNQLRSSTGYAQAIYTFHVL